MLVVDASVLLESLLRTPAAVAVDQRLFGAGQSLHAPHVIDIEIAQVLRSYHENGEIGLVRAAQALDDLRDLRLDRYGHDLLMPRIWALRELFTPQAAAYVALAQALEVPLLTRDARLVEAALDHINAELV